MCMNVKLPHEKLPVEQPHSKLSSEEPHKINSARKAHIVGDYGRICHVDRQEGASK